MSNRHVAVVLPTYNERDNIIALLRSLVLVRKKLHHLDFSIVVVDDESPDGTGALVEQYSQQHPDIHLLTGTKEGLGVAYVRGFGYALNVLQADTIIQMDADFSHDPGLIPSFIRASEQPLSFVIGSRYVEGGTIPENWPFRRVMISKTANLLARVFAGFGKVRDCTSGYRAIDATLLRKIDISHIGADGYSFQINMLHAGMAVGGVVTELPIQFVDRTAGVSKMRLYDIVEFLGNILRLSIRNRHPLTYAKQHAVGLVLGSVAAILLFLTGLLVFGVASIKTVAIGIFLVVSLAITVQSFFTLMSMLYAWNEPKRTAKNRSPKLLFPPKHSFTALIPALHEEQVIGDTIRAVAQIEYPESLKEILVICRADDEGTIAAAKKEIAALDRTNIRVIIPDVTPRNKPDKLNYALQFATKEVVCVFDAEDAPHRDLYQIVNTVMVRDGADVVQSGVQLVNFQSSWFSTLNVLEYFFWFKSVLHFFAQKQVIPLGGNTVFFKKTWLDRLGGWDANCLTEDADMGIALSSAGARIRIIYDEEHATQEETPPTLASFIKQRTRWNQGFIQVFKKKQWKKLPLLSQRLLVGYILIWPEIQAALFVYALLSLVMIFTVKLPIVVTMVSLLPCYILLMHFILLNVGLYEFTKKYAARYPVWMPLKIAVTFIPFQFLLGLSAIRAVYREMRKQTSWEKTEHTGAHREIKGASVSAQYGI